MVSSTGLNHLISFYKKVQVHFGQNTEETETIDGLTDHWLKIEYASNKYGWIFGGYASVERGGPKYYIPEAMIIFDLSWY